MKAQCNAVGANFKNFWEATSAVINELTILFTREARWVEIHSPKSKIRYCTALAPQMCEIRFFCMRIWIWTQIAHNSQFTQFTELSGDIIIHLIWASSIRRNISTWRILIRCSWTDRRDQVLFDSQPHEFSLAGFQQSQAVGSDGRTSRSVAKASYAVVPIQRTPTPTTSCIHVLTPTHSIKYFN